MMVTMKVTIHDVAPLALTLLVDFSYTGELVVSEDNVQVFVLPMIRIIIIGIGKLSLFVICNDLLDNNFADDQ